MATRCHSLSFVVACCTTCCHSLSLVVIRCHPLYHSLALVVIRCHSLYHSLSLVGIRCHSLSVFCFRYCFCMHNIYYTLKMISKNIFSWDAFKSYTEHIFNKYCSSFTIRVGLLSKLVIGLLYNPVIRWHHNYFWMVVFKVSTLWQSHCFLNIF